MRVDTSKERAGLVNWRIEIVGPRFSTIVTITRIFWPLSLSSLPFRVSPISISLSLHPRAPPDSLLSRISLQAARWGLILESNHLSLMQHGWYRRRSDSGIIYRVFLQRHGEAPTAAASRRFRAHEMNSLLSRRSEHRRHHHRLRHLKYPPEFSAMAAVRLFRPNFRARLFAGDVCDGNHCVSSRASLSFSLSFDCDLQPLKASERRR